MDKLTSGPASYILPIAMGAGAMASPRIGAGLGTALGVVDWARRNRKEGEQQEAFASLPKYFGGPGTTPENTGLTTAALAGGEGAQVPTPTPSGPAPAAAGGKLTPAQIDAAMADPVIQKSPDAMAKLIAMKLHFSTLEPHQQLVPTDTGYAQLITPRMGGAPTVTPIPGLTPPQKFNQGLEDVLFATFGKGPHTPEQVQQGRSILLKQTEEAENRKNQLIIDRQVAGQGRLLTQQEAAAERTRAKEDRTRAHSDFVGLNSWWDKNLKAIDDYAAKEIAAAPGGSNTTMGKKKIAEVEAWRKQQRQGLVEEYQGGYNDLKSRYEHVKEGLPWSGNKQTIVDIRIKKHGSTVGGEDVDETAVINKLRQNNPKDAADYQKILQSGDQEAINKARQRVKKFMGQ